MSRWVEWEARLERAVDWLNPILVKEARQSLKSNHFVLSFMLLLGTAVVWSFFGLFQGAYSGVLSSSATMLSGYLLILLFPLFLIVPFSTYRSLAAEREDGTFELMSITDLNARQIVLGKLASATLQIILYFSALAPCIAFTYLLRGIDIVTIAIVLFDTLAASWILAAFGLYVATATAQRHWQVLNSLVLLLLLVLAMFSWFSYSMFMIRQTGLVNQESSGFITLQFIFITAGISLGLLFIERGASRITFASDNQATRVRWVFLLQFALWLAWHGYYRWHEQASDSGMQWVFMVYGAAIYAALVGAPMLGEPTRLSQRVRRGLPKTFLERMTLSWFMPGSASGYFFVLSTLLGVILFTLTLKFWSDMTGASSGTIAGLARPPFQVVTVCILVWSYLAFYLGLSRLVVRWISRRTTITPALSTLFTILFVAIGTAAPLLLHMAIIDWSTFDYSWMHWPNVFWTLSIALELNYADHFAAIFTVIGAALLIFVMNMHDSARELSQAEAN